MHLYIWVNSPLSGAQAFCVPSPPKTNRSNNQTRRLKFQLRASYFCAEFTFYVSFQLRLCVQRFSKKPPEREGSKNTPRRERSTRCKDTLRLFYTLSRFCRIARGYDLTEISFRQSWLAKRAPGHFPYSPITFCHCWWL
jgi:hypothetical protein